MHAHPGMTYIIYNQKQTISMQFDLQGNLLQLQLSVLLLSIFH